MGGESRPAGPCPPVFLMRWARERRLGQLLGATYTPWAPPSPSSLIRDGLSLVSETERKDVHNYSGLHTHTTISAPHSRSLVRIRHSPRPTSQGALALAQHR